MRDERRSPWPNFGSRHSCPSVAVYAVIPDGGNRHNGMSAICAKRPSADWVLTLGRRGFLQEREKAKIACDNQKGALCFLLSSGWDAISLTRRGLPYLTWPPR